jgi:hypothetical protein
MRGGNGIERDGKKKRQKRKEILESVAGAS